MIFTICSNNYLAQALSLGASITRQSPGYPFEIFLVDQPDDAIDYTALGYKTTFISEEIVPGLDKIVEAFNIIELNTAVKPFVFQYLFSRDKNIQELYYLDPDTYFFADPRLLSDTLKDHDFSITPHVNSPIPIDGRQPQEELFLNYGIYNLGYIGIRKSKSGDDFLKWWAERTYKKGIIKLEEGLFVDQLWINYLPVFWEGVHVVKSPGLNMGPWNLHERVISKKEDHFFVNESSRLVFYHFSSYNPANEKHIVKGQNYNRYDFDNRPDLVEIYSIYQNEITGKDYKRFGALKKVYSSKYEQRQKKLKREHYKKKPIRFLIDALEKLDR